MSAAIEQTDAHLLRVFANQMFWKHDACAKLAVRILKLAVSGVAFYPEEVEQGDIAPKDKNCVGAMFKHLARAKMISRTTHFRRSTAASSNGRTVFAYVLVNRGLAVAALARLGHRAEPRQRELVLR